MGDNTIFILFAGGKSERMGVDKGLLKYQHTFWILEQLNRISKSKISSVYIGLGHNYQHYFNAIPWFENALTQFVNYQGLNVKVVINQQPKLGTFSTLQAVLQNIDSKNDILVNHIDIPILNSTELNKLINTKNIVVIPNFEGKNGHPIKMNFDFWQHLLSLNVTHKDARLDFQIKKINPTRISKIEIYDRAIILNLNTIEEWKSFLGNSNS